MEHAQLKISGIQCDNETCDYRESDVKFEEYSEWVNKPCPKCGENLLTQENYDECLELMKRAEMINSLSEEELEAMNKHVMENLDNETINQMLDFFNNHNMKIQNLEDGGVRVFGGWHKKFDEEKKD